MVQPATTPEHWTELIAARRQRRVLTEQVAALKRSCASECGKKHVSECPKCWPLVIDKMRQRYIESPDREWFTSRKAFHQELEELFADAKEHRISIRQIEARIESEKEAWYRWILRKHAEFLVTCNDDLVHDELRGMLDDPDRSRDEVVEMMWRGIGKPPDWAERVDAFAARVAAAGGNSAALKKLYVDEFFLDKETSEPLEDSKPYLDEYLSNENMGIEEILGKIMKDAQESRNLRPQRDMHTARLDDLRRAKMADELNKKQQAKSQAQAAQERVVGDDLYNLPPCLVCGKTLDTHDVFSCPICQAVTQMGGKKELTVFCSEECHAAGFDDHTSEAHACESGENCVQERSDGQVDDVEMDDGTAQDGFICRECLGLKRVTAFCSERCAFENVVNHYKRNHEAKADADEVSSLVRPMQETLESILRRENPRLHMEWLT
ncbi:hypothetical protein A9Z42_0005690 [Trichoderma parareesei]|uniref:Suppressor of anucleate metulae protein B n=1 Tax=Trichoderma parareesei TaxID=858221 RepID=A0A2H3A8H6_TRIPA|nr:hypothetical protein A9Z42_0005690 [Trichoderma parareesei]